MAYNIPNNEVKKAKADLTDKMLDKDSNQEIHGTKIFTNGITAKYINLLDGTLITPTAITEIKNNKPNAILITNGDKKKTATAAAKLSYENNILIGEHAIFKSIEGGGKKLRDLPANELRGPISLDLIATHAQGGITTTDNELGIDLSDVLSINLHAQTLSDGDTILVHDVSRNALRKTTLKNLYREYMTSKISQPDGPTNSLQVKKGASFAGSPHLTFNDSTSTLRVEGTTHTVGLTAADRVDIGGTLACQGAHYEAITTITNEEYTVQDGDYTILADSTDNKVCITLPDAADHVGRVVNIKLIHTNRFSLKAPHLTIQSENCTVDLFDDIVIKMPRSSRTFQSDGKNWWVIGGRGT